MSVLDQYPASALREAAQRVRPHVHRTPVLTSVYFDRLLGREVFFKCENFQKVGAFKFRGATNTLRSLSADEQRRGVVAHSSGNHGQAVALAASQCDSRATVVMPSNSAEVKVAAVREYGAEVVFCEPTSAAREAASQQIVAETGAVLVHPFNDARIILGQATAALELFEEIADLDLVVVPIGGGGLASGTALAAGHFSAATAVVGVEPEGADTANRSLEEGRLIAPETCDTVADGLRSGLGELTFAVLSELLRGIVTVTDAQILRAMRDVWERMKILIEPSAAVPVAALINAKIDVANQRIGVILSGGNIDLDRLPWSR